MLRDPSTILSILYNPLIHQVIRENRELSTEDYENETKMLKTHLLKYLATFFKAVVFIQSALIMCAYAHVRIRSAMK